MRRLVPWLAPVLLVVACTSGPAQSGPGASGAVTPTGSDVALSAEALAGGAATLAALMRTGGNGQTPPSSLAPETKPAVAVLAAPGAAKAGAAQTPTAGAIRRNGVTGPVWGFIEGVAESSGEYLGGQMLNEAGITTSAQLRADTLAGMQVDLSALLSQVGAVLSGEQTVVQQLSQIQAQLTASEELAYVSLIAKVIQPMSGAYALFNNALADPDSPTQYYSVPQILTDFAVQSQVADAYGCVQQPSSYYECNGLGSLWNDAQSLISADPDAGALISEPDFANTVFGAIRANGEQGFPQAGTAAPSSYDMAAVLNQSNQTIVGYLTQFASILQSNYTMMASLLVLEYCAVPSGGTVPALCTQAGNPTWTTPIPNQGLVQPTPAGGISPFSEVNFPWEGYTASKSLQENLAVLNSSYAPMFTELQTSADAHLLSDLPQWSPPAGTSWPTLTPVATLPGAPGGSWSSSCPLYVWPGQFGPSSPVGTWSGINLGVSCPDTSTPPLSLSTCAPSNLDVSLAPVNVVINSGGGFTRMLSCAGGLSHTMLSPRVGQLNVSPGQQFGYHVGGSTNFTWQWPAALSPLQNAVWNDTFPPTSLTPTSAYIQVSPGIPNWAQVSLQLDTGNGYIGPVILNITNGKEGSSPAITTQVACLQGDPLCASNPADDYQSICYAGYTLTTDRNNVIDLGDLGSCLAND